MCEAVLTHLGRKWSSAGSQMAWSMPLRMPRNLCIWGAMAGCPPTCAQIILIYRRLPLNLLRHCA